MPRDPVCGMNVNEDRAAGRSDYLGRSYYFCSDRCKMEFDKSPDRYARPDETGGRDDRTGRTGRTGDRS